MIYVVQSGTTKDAPIKIGQTTARRKGKRKGELQVGNPEKLYVIAKLRGRRKRESELHERFASSRIHGEWFHRTPQIQAWLDEIDAALPSHALAISDEFAIERWGSASTKHRVIFVAVILALWYLILS